jgi:hypothetical protein
MARFEHLDRKPMSNIEQMGETLMKSWGAKTLEAFRQQAKAAPTGVVFDAIRSAERKRLMLVICATKKEQIAALEKAFQLAASGAPDDWTKLSLLEIAMRAAAVQGVFSKSLKNSAGEISDVILVSAEPHSIALIERMFSMPK